MASIRTEIRSATRSATVRFTCPITVESIVPLTPHFQRVTVSGSGLSGYTSTRPADAFKLLLPSDGEDGIEFPSSDDEGMPQWPAGSRPVLRAYTVRHFDTATNHLTFDVAIHGGGFGTTWLNGARPGDTVGLAGMRHEFHAGTDVDRHVLTPTPAGCPQPRPSWPR